MKKLNLFSAYEAIGIMQWLNEQAAYGWELKKWGALFVRFAESDGERYQYQIDLDNWEDGANEERRSELEALGWKYVDTIGGTKMHIYRSEDLSISIPPNEDFIALHQKRLRITPLRVLLSFLLALVTVIFPMISYLPYYLLELTTGNKYEFPLIIVLWLMVVYAYIKGLWEGRKLYRYLEDIKKTPIKEILHQGDHYERNIFLKVLYWSLLIAGIIALWRMERIQDERDLTDADAGTRYVNMAEFQDDDFELGETTWSWSDFPEINRDQWISYTDGMFTDRYYEVTQAGWRSGDAYERLEGNYWTGVHDMIKDQLFAQSVERYTAYHYHYELLHRKEYDTSESWVVSEQSDERFDRLVIAQGILKFYDTRLIFAQIDDNVIYLKYQGNKDTSVLLEELVKTF